MSDSAWTELFKTILPAVSLLAIGVVTALIAKLKTKLEENTTITAKARAAVQDSSKVQETGFKEIGEWRYAIDTKMALIDRAMVHLEQRVDESHKTIIQLPAVVQAVIPQVIREVVPEVIKNVIVP